MNYDMDMCSGVLLGDSPCPLRDDCLRYIQGQRALNENFPYIWWMQYPPYKDGKCELQSKQIDDEKRESEKQVR